MLRFVRYGLPAVLVVTGFVLQEQSAPFGPGNARPEDRTAGEAKC